MIKKINALKGILKKGLYLPQYHNPNISFLKKFFPKKISLLAAQKRIEEVVIEFIKENIKGETKLALAGGVLSNVKNKSKNL